MITTSEVNTFKTFAEMQVNNINGGAMYLVTEGDKIVWNLSSGGFKIRALEAGEKLSSESCSMKAIKEKKTLSIKLPRSIYGVRIHATATPIVDGQGTVVGAATIVFPRLHPVATAFGKFAPMLAEMFPEGVFLYVTDLQKVSYRQPSKKFELKKIEVGRELQDMDIASKTIKNKSLTIQELDAGKYGVPVLMLSYPLFDEEDETQIVGSFGIAIPKTTAAHLREMSGTLDKGLSGISAAIEELAASASQIHTNERELNDDIKEIYKYSEQIEQISAFIKQVADQTNMLGLNAAIEAARAGGAGQGFGVVAEEIRKLSVQSNNVVPQIRELTNLIKKKVNAASQKSGVSLESSQEQAAATEEIIAGIEEMNSLAEQLNEISKDV